MGKFADMNKERKRRLNPHHQASALKNDTWAINSTRQERDPKWTAWKKGRGIRGGGARGVVGAPSGIMSPYGSLPGRK